MQMEELQNLKNVIRKGENEHLEIFMKVNYDAIGRTVCAFLNKEGGQILIQFGHKNDITMDDLNTQADSIRKFIQEKVIPNNPFSVSIESIDDLKYIMVKVLEGSKQPYVFNGEIFVRKVSRTLKASPEDLSQLISNRHSAQAHWERSSTLGFDIEDLDTYEILNTISEGLKRERIKDSELQSLDEEQRVLRFLTNYGLYQNGNATNAAVVLFGRNPSRFIPQIRVRLASFTESKTDSIYNYDHILEGNLFQNIHEITKFLEYSAGTNSRFHENQWQREDFKRYPAMALREGILNALIHRDYENVSGTVLIAVYPDKIEISNSGELPKELTTADLKKNHLSLPRNPDIAQICFLRGWIEKLGRGTLKILEQCRELELKEPKWTSNKGVTTLLFFGPGYSSRDEVFDKLNERQLNLIRDTKAGEDITVPEYLEHIEYIISDRAARTDFYQLIDGGWFEKIPAGRKTFYRRTKQGI